MLSDLISVCRTEGAGLDGLKHQGRPVDGPLLLWAISGVESSFGKHALFARHEPSYMPGGYYYRRSPLLRSLWDVYGVLASCSYGAFQILYSTAYEVGFRDHPIKLQDHATCARWAKTLIVKRFIDHQGALTLEHILDAYNSGNFRDGNVPTDYVRKGLLYYQQGWPDQDRT